MGGHRKRYTIPLRGSEAQLGLKTWVMGVLNVTPDSFSDGGRFAALDAAVAHGMQMFEAGADMVDVGGESTRPRATPVSSDEEARRVAPVIEQLRRRGAGPISVDTAKAAVARAALDAGADLVNDVSGFRFDDQMGPLVAERGVPVVLMHLRGDFATMHAAQRYSDVIAEIASELEQAIQRAEQKGVKRERIIVDPGIGFSKDAAASLEVVRRLGALQAVDRPVLAGPSRKRFIGAVLDNTVDERLFGTAAAVAACVLGGAHIVRVHDVRPMRDVVRLADAIRGDA